MPLELHAGLYGLVANVLVLASLSVGRPPERPDETARFLDVARGE